MSDSNDRPVQSPTTATGGGLEDESLDQKDVSYSPASETETEAKQSSDETHSDVTDERVKTLPGTGGPDDVGEIEVDPDDLDLGGSQFPGHAR